jgi:hypothetical protein
MKTSTNASTAQAYQVEELDSGASTSVHYFTLTYTGISRATDSEQDDFELPPPPAKHAPAVQQKWSANENVLVQRQIHPASLSTHRYCELMLLQMPDYSYVNSV